MAELHWFPFYIDRWKKSARVPGMLPEQRGAYLDLLIAAWGDGTSEPCLPCDDIWLAKASGLDARWKKMGGIVRSMFVERDGKLYSAFLSEVWREQQDKHEKAVKRATAGGKASGEKRRNNKRATSSTPSSPQVEHAANSRGTELDQEEAVEIPSEFQPASPPVGALSAEAPRAPGGGPPTRCGAVLDDFMANVRRDLKPGLMQ